MAIRKKHTAESETMRADDSAKAGQKSSRARNTAGAETAGMSDNKTGKSQSPAAATHKSSARTTTQAAPAAAEVGTAGSIEKTTFDVALHHEEISKEAYCNWLHNGCPQGSEQSDWVAAIEIVRARYEK